MFVVMFKILNGWIKKKSKPKKYSQKQIKLKQKLIYWDYIYCT